MIESSITNEIVEDLHSRTARGLYKYGTTLDGNNKDDFMNHLYEELLDAVQYIKKEQSIVPTIQQLINNDPNDSDLGALIRRMYGKEM